LRAACLALVAACCACTSASASGPANRADEAARPAENVVPLVRRDAVARYGQRLLAALDTVSARLTTGSLRALDAQVELRGQDPRMVAESWLRAHGLISAGGDVR
jgi:hypothetical protein